MSARRPSPRPRAAGFVARAGLRADLAGGTLDIWPMGLLHPPALTVAVTLDLVVEARARSPRRAGELELRSLDLGRRRRLTRPWPPLRRGPLELLERLARDLSPGGVHLETCSPVAAGSGLGTSSALGLAAAAALTALAGRRGPRRELVRLVADVEAQVLGIPTGVQDHLAALHGGVIVLEHRPGGSRLHRVEPRVVDRLARHLLLVDGGCGRSSAPSNWDMIRRRLDGEGPARRALERVARAARRAAEALVRGDWRALGRAMRADAAARRSWSGQVYTPRLEAIVAAARRAGSWGEKVCGAGGGGYLVLLVEPSRREPVAEAVRRAGGRPAPVGLRRTGLRVSGP
ncbi:MAG: hypothetical protein Q9Q40_01690 [Acidobacteriota bacterium]|nr:hypothetical protein [Acidobacteriota bacterium]MDQ7086382.1 hypothetical protein [Acidobacteriota bacterium]